MIIGGSNDEILAALVNIRRNSQVPRLPRHLTISATSGLINLVTYTNVTNLKPEEETMLKEYEPKFRTGGRRKCERLYCLPHCTLVYDSS